MCCFKLIGTTYGGDGVNTFALPDLRGRVPINQGQGSGLQNYILGQSAGIEAATLSSAQLPVHTHTLNTTQLTASVKCKNGPGNSQIAGRQCAGDRGRRRDHDLQLGCAR